MRSEAFLSLTGPTGSRDEAEDLGTQMAAKGLTEPVLTEWQKKHPRGVIFSKKTKLFFKKK